MSFDPDLYRRTVKLPGRGDAGVDLNISVIDAGPRDALRTVLFLHGMGGYAGYWHHQLNHFYQASRVIAPDLRGHGLSDAPHSSYTREELLADIEGIIAALDLPERFILVTHSFGGALGTLYTQAHPERVSKLVIIGSAVRFDKLKNAGRFLLKAPSWLLSGIMNILPMGRRYPPGHVIHAQYNHAVITYDGTTALQAIRCPTLVILGERDRLFDSSAYQAIAKLITGAQEVTMPLSAHQVMVERPDAVNRALDRFLGPVQLAVEQALRRERSRTLERERPWVKFYDGRTPYQIRPPQGPLQRHLEIAARRFANVPALQFLRRSISYKQLDRLANRFAVGLRKQGLTTGARVLIVLPNIPQAVIAYFAILKAGGVVVFIEPQASAEQIVQQAAEVGAEVVIALSTRYSELHSNVSLLDRGYLVFVGFRDYMGLWDWLRFTVNHHYADGHAMPLQPKLVKGRQVFRFYQLLSLKTDKPETEPKVDDLAVIHYTSGSGDTPPKAVCLSHGNLTANALQVRHWLPESRVGDERILAVGGIANSLSATVNLAPMLGATVILVPRFDALAVLHTIKHRRPTFLPASPRIYQLLAEVPQVRKYGIASIRVCFSAGTNLPVEVQESFEKLTKGRVVDAYTVAESGVCLANPLAARKRPGAVGVPLPDVQAKLVSTITGLDCGNDEVGELWLRGPQLSQGYWNQPEATAQHFKDGWFSTGDLARRDADGFFYLLERQDNVIHSQIAEDMVDIYPREIEEVLYELQEVSEVAVTAWYNADGAREIVAFIVPRTHAPLDIAHLYQWCQSRLQPDARPTQFQAIEHMPRSPAGKVLRRALRAKFEGSSTEG
jgi:long-chain acyl-CoA synthetase